VDVPSPDRDPEAVAEDALGRFRRTCVSALPLRAALAEELAVEARPTVSALLVATSHGRVDDTESLEHHETLALLTLLGRKLALLGGTPTAALRLAPTLLRAVRDAGWALPPSLDEPLTTLAVEGYVRGREERIHGDAAKDAVDRIHTVALAEGCLAVFPKGSYEPDLLEAAMEELGRRMFRQEASVCLVVLDGVSNVTPAMARAVLSIDESARTLGATAIFAGMNTAFTEAADRAGLDRSHLHVAEDVTDGVRRALSIAGYALKRVSWLPAPIRDWFTQGGR
jgi:hypothetical protein